MAAHKECLGRVPACGRNSGSYTCTLMRLNTASNQHRYHRLNQLSVVSLMVLNYRCGHSEEGKTALSDFVEMFHIILVEVMNHAFLFGLC